MKKLFIGTIIVFLLSSFFVSAACTNSVDLDISSFERTPGDETFKVVATANNNGDCLSVAWGKNDLNQLLDGESPDEIATKDISGGITIISQKDEFSTTLNSNEEYYSYEVMSTGNPLIGSCESKCVEEFGEYDYMRSSLSNCYCIYKGENPRATFGDFSGLQTYSGKATISFPGLTQKTINFGKNSESIDIDGKVQVEWRGDLMGGSWNSPPNWQIYKDHLGKYYLTENSYQTINDIEPCLDEINFQVQQVGEMVSECISSHNQAVENKLTSSLSKYVSENPTIDYAKFDGSRLVAEKEPYSSSFPQFTLTFDAEWAGIKWITGKPEITCPTSVNFDSGDTANIELSVQNIDFGEQGAFTLNVDCDEGLSTTITDNKMSFEPGETKEVVVEITGSSKFDSQSSCTVVVYPTKESDNKKTCDVGVTIKSLLRECPPSACCLDGGQYFEQECDESLECCISTGSYIGDCKRNCRGNIETESVSGNLNVATEDGEDKGALSPTMFNEDRQGGSGGVIIFILIVLAAGFGIWYFFLGGKEFFGKGTEEEIVEDEELEKDSEEDNPECEEEVEDEESNRPKFCGSCGEKLLSTGNFCPKCGEKT